MKKVFFMFLFTGVFAFCAFCANEDSLLLVGCKYPQEVRAGGSFEITFYMQAVEPIKKECGLFLHLYSGKAKAMVNADAALPYAATKWKPLEVVKVGPIRVFIPHDSPAGDYSIEAGLFWAQETPLGNKYNKIPYINYPRPQDWQIGKISVIEPDEDLFLPKADKEFGVYLQDSLTKVFPERPFFAGGAAEEINLSLARGEFESFQVSVASLTRDLKGVRFALSDLVNRKAKSSIPKKELELFTVGYVPTKKPYYNTARVGLWPDPLLPFKDAVDIERGALKTFWLRLRAPEKIPAGKYEGKLDILSQNGALASLKINLIVWDFDLPKTTHLKTAFDLKEEILLKYYPMQENETADNYASRIEALKRAYYLDMLAHRLDPVHNFGNPKLLGIKDGVYQLDFTDFDSKAEFYLRRGQKTFSIGEYWPWQSKAMWGKWYGLKDEAAVLGSFGAYGRHLEEKGWLKNSYAYIFDETFFRVKEVTGLIHKACPQIKNLLTMTPEPEYKDIDIWCARINNFQPDSVKELKAQGKEVWVYVAGTTRPYPNLNMDVEAVEYRILPWICWKFNIEGLLYWAVNWWVDANPWISAMTYHNQNGDGFLYYPGKEGPVGSIRLEVLRDGLEDYELFFLLREKTQELEKVNTSGRYDGLLKDSREALSLDDEIGPLPAYYTRDAGSIYRKREVAAKLIQRISSLLQ